MRTVLSAFILLLLAAIQLYSQEAIQQYFVLDSIIPLNKVGDFGPSSRNIIMAAGDSFLLCYVGTDEDKSDGLSFIRLHLPSKKVDSFTVQVPNPNFPLSSLVANKMALNQRYCVLLFHKSIIVLEFSNNQLQFKRWIPLQTPYGYIGIQGTTIIVGRCYNSHPLDADTPTALLKINAESGVIGESIYPSFDAIELSHFQPSHWVDFSSNFIAFSQTLEYKIDIFNKELKRVFTITKNEWNRIDTSALHAIRQRSERTEPKQIIEELRKSLGEDGQRIIGINFISDSMLVVCGVANQAKEKKMRTFYYDIWQLSNGQWKLYHENLKDTKPMGNIVCHAENFPYSGIDYNSTFTKEWTASVRVAPDRKILLQPGKEYSKIYTETDNYISRHEPTFQIYIYKLRIQQ
ncbi:MAG: hypothetical protein JST20_10745 [Bacteroidetes bacterium]|nr:hypothetical protein [Bacteroidota bacterium]